MYAIRSYYESEDEFVDYGPIDEKIIVDYLAKNNIDAQRDSSGMYYYVDKRGEEDTIPEDAFLDCFVIGYTASDRITSYNVCYTKLLRAITNEVLTVFFKFIAGKFQEDQS